MPPVTSAAPCGSKAVPSALLPRSLASRASAPAATATQTGGFTKKIHRQPGPCEITPPRKTPAAAAIPLTAPQTPSAVRSEEHTSELQSRGHLVCRLLLEKK